MISQRELTFLIQLLVNKFAMMKFSPCAHNFSFRFSNYYLAVSITQKSNNSNLWEKIKLFPAFINHIKLLCRACTPNCYYAMQLFRALASVFQLKQIAKMWTKQTIFLLFSFARFTSNEVSSQTKLIKQSNTLVECARKHACLFAREFKGRRKKARLTLNKWKK